MRKAMPDLSDLATPGATIPVRVTPKAARDAIIRENGGIRIYVTTLPEDGKANAAVTKLLARALGIARSRLTLMRGAASRDKLFRID